MSELSVLAGLGTEIVVGGTTYRLRPLDRSDWARIEERILSKRGDPVAVVAQLAKDAPLELARELYAKAYDDATAAKTVTAGELDQWRLSLDGMVFQFWLQIRKEHPDVTEEKAGELLEQAGREFLARATEALLKQFPEATQDDVIRIATQQEEGWLAELISKASGLPEGNSSTPAKGPGTPTSRSTGDDGTPN